MTFYPAYTLARYNKCKNSWHVYKPGTHFRFAWALFRATHYSDGTRWRSIHGN